MTPNNKERKMKEWTVQFGGKLYLFVGVDAPKITQVSATKIRGLTTNAIIIDEAVEYPHAHN